MELRLIRDTFNADCTLGELQGAGQVWQSLELPVKDGLPKSAIPPGLYQVIEYPSPKFGCLMPLVIGIPGRSEIEIHFGNTVRDTDGCILIGTARQSSTEAWELLESRLAFDEFWQVFSAAKAAGETVSLQVIGGRPNAGEGT